jgi:hypothetical protein
MAKKPDRTSTPGKGEIVLYQAPDGKAALDVRLEGETLWLNQKQLSDLFQTERSVITKHLRNIFRSGELERNSVCAKFAHTAEDGKVYQTTFYNLDAIISVGYRVNSKRGTQFRIWATNVLREHLVRGFTLNAGFRCLVPYNCRKALCKRNSGFEEKIRGQSGRFCKLPQCYRRIGEPMGTGREAASRAISQALGACA